MGDETVTIRVRGRVQGVGFRPTVWRHAQDSGVDGHVLNDGEGVLILARAGKDRLARFIRLIQEEPPPLAAISGLDVAPSRLPVAPGFHIVESKGGVIATEVAPDMATCPACRAEIADPGSRRHRYPFTNCTHCGPRLTVITRLPYDRPSTTLRPFPLCPACQTEYDDPADRRFHAEATACPACGPRLRLVRWGHGAVDGDPIVGAARVIAEGEIVAVKALGGYQLACDAGNPSAVATLRRRKRRDGKPLAVLVRDIAMAGEIAFLSQIERGALASREAPIVLCRRRAGAVADAVAPGLTTLGIMLAANPVHMLLAEAVGRPMVMTSGNMSGAPQIIDDDAAERRLAEIAPHALVHDRAIANRIDDSVVAEIGGALRVLRRGRGYAPATLPLPPGFDGAPDTLAFGAELKASFCLIAAGRVILAQHQGDLDHAETLADFEHQIGFYADLYAHRPARLACDRHPDCRATRLAAARAATDDLPLVQVQHHHAHLAACLGENDVPREAPPVFGLVLDGVGLGSDGTAWGGELLLGDYRRFRRLGRLMPAALIGGDAAAREPWRNLYAQLRRCGALPLVDALPDGHRLRQALQAKPLATLAAMLARDVNAPLSSSAGRLFDAVAAALGCGFDRQSHEGEAAMRLEALVDTEVTLAYPFDIVPSGDLVELDPAPMWRALLADLGEDVPAGHMAAKFHNGLGRALGDLVRSARARLGANAPTAVALSGGCFQNRLLFERTAERLSEEGLAVLSNRLVPMNDGGIAYGQALVAAAITSEA